MTNGLRDLETPCLVADRSRIDNNAGRMRARAEQHGFSLRPHLKTTKSAAVARIAHGGGTGPVTVSTLREADYLLANGFSDLCYAVALSPNKFRHVRKLIDDGAGLKVLLADVSVTKMLADFAVHHDVSIRVYLEIDSGEHRTGFAPAAAALVDAARIVTGSDALVLHGLLTHGGHSYQCRNTEAIADVAEQERQSLLTAKKLLEADGIGVDVVSSGSTPTAVHGRNFEGITEMRPGVYLAGDLFQAQLGSCAFDDIAISVLATVIAHDRDRNRLVIDAGGLALSKDRSTQNSAIDYGYGLLVKADGSAFGQDLIVAGVHQEHGEVASADALPFDQLPVGSLVRVLPNHACMMAAAYERYVVVDGIGSGVVDTWDKVYAW